MRNLRTLLVACLAVGAAAAQAGGAAAPPAGPATIYVQVGRAWLSPTTAASDVWLVVENGVLTNIAPKASLTPPPGAEVVELPEGWALPTFVHAHADDLSDPTDPEDGVTPDAVAADQFDPFLSRDRWLARGVARAFLPSGSQRLVPGQGSIVRLNAANPAAATLVRAAALRIDLRDHVRGTPDVWEPPDVPTAERPLPPSRVQGPKTRAGAVARVRGLFSEAAAWSRGKPARKEGEVDLAPFVAALDGKLPVRIAADRYADVAAAVALARDFGLRLTIEGGNEAWRLANELAAVKASVVLRLARATPVEPDPAVPLFLPDGEPHPEAPAILKRAGVPVALIPPRGAADDELWFHATRALRNDGSFGADDVLAATTWGAAEILGIPDARANPVGRPAEFAVFAGSPFETTARPTLVLAEGRTAAKSAARKDLLAITAARVHTCEGDALRDATVLVENGRIVSVGRRLAIPPEARRMRAEVVVPGFVDAGVQVGLRAYSVGADDVVGVAPPQPGSMEQPLSEWFDARSPHARAAAAAGVTTLALSPTGGRLVSGVISTVKSAGSGDRTAKAASGVVFDLAAVPANNALKKQIESALEQGKKYHESWVAYEKALAEWEAKGKPAAPAAERKALPQVAAPKTRDPLTGTWEGTLTTTVVPRPIPFTLKFKLEGTSVTGTATSSMFPGQERAFSGGLKDGVLLVEYAEGNLKATFKANVGREVMTGTGSAPGLGEGSFEARRTERPGDAEDAKPESKPTAESKPAAKADEPKKDDAKTDEGKKDAADDGRPKAPRKDDGLEPFRELFADRAAAYVNAPTERHAEIALEVFRGKFDLRTVLTSAQELPALVDRIKASGAAFATSVSEVRGVDGPRYSPAATAFGVRIPTLLRSGVGGDPRNLYALAEEAVRDGVDPDDALRMITRQPARFLGLLDRVGSLERGKDADLVLLSGEPFEAGTRIVRVMVDGVFVGEEKTR